MHALNLYKTEAIDTLAWPVVENTITRFLRKFLKTAAVRNLFVI